MTAINNIDYDIIKERKIFMMKRIKEAYDKAKKDGTIVVKKLNFKGK